MLSNKKTESTMTQTAPLYSHWEKTKDLIDQLIDITLNYRQSGHPGGSRSKVYAMVSLLLSGAMRWDIRHPEKRFTDRFILGAGHTIPLVYCTLAVLNEVMRVKYQQTGDQRYALNPDSKRVLTWEDLLTFRRSGGLSGHAEMEGCSSSSTPVPLVMAHLQPLAKRSPSNVPAYRVSEFFSWKVKAV
jgi:hypothetical protein